MNTVTVIGCVFLVPFWWGMALLALAVLGDVSPSWRPRVARLFDRLERTPRPSPDGNAP